MPILLMGVVALAIFLALGLLFFTAMEAERRKRAKADKPDSDAPKTNANAAGR